MKKLFKDLIEKIKMAAPKTKFFLLLAALFPLITIYFHIKALYSGEIIFGRHFFSPYSNNDALRTYNFQPVTFDIKDQTRVVLKKIDTKPQGSTSSKKKDNNVNTFQEKVKLITSKYKNSFSFANVGIMDVENGNVLALYNSSECKLSDPICYSQLYEPGSTFKIFIDTAFLESEQNIPFVSCNPKKNKLACTAHPNGTDKHLIRPMEAITVSCNNAFAEYMKYISRQDIKNEKSALYQFNRLAYSFGFQLLPDEENKTDLLSTNFFAGEKIEVYKPFITNTRFVSDKTRLGIGQRYVKTNILFQLQFVSAIANGGYLVSPKLDKDIPTEKSRKPILKNNTVTVLKQFLFSAVNSTSYNITGRANKILGNLKEGKVSGKTGTVETNNKYNNTWFIGYFPSENPEIAFAVMSAEDKTGNTPEKIIREIISEYAKTKEAKSE